MDEKCPESCPLYVDHREESLPCDFSCVGNSIQSCKSVNPSTPVPDLTRGECRRCEVVGCDQCTDDGRDRCAKCLPGYYVSEDGQCYSSGFLKCAFAFLYLVLLIIAVSIFFVVWWIVDLALRKQTNNKALDHSLKLREQAKVHQAKLPGQPRELYPLKTNLCSQDVAGPAVLLLFNFQVALIIWAAVLALVWCSLGYFVDPAMDELGTREAETLRQDCINIKWGHYTQTRLMWLKVGFLEFAYMFSFVGAILFGIRQRRLHQHYGVDQTSHQDYAIILEGLPEIRGHEKVEDKLLEAIKMTTQEPVIGVSVGWQLNENSRDLLQETMESRLRELAGLITPPGSAQVTPRQDDTPRSDSGRVIGALGALQHRVEDMRFCQWMRYRLHKIFVWIEKLFVKPSTQKILSRGRRKAGLQNKSKKRLAEGYVAGLMTAATPGEDPVSLALHELKTSSLAFVVFETQQSRDKVLATWTEKPLEFKSKALQVSTPDFEPSAVLWHNLAPERTMKTQCLRVAGMFLFVVLMIGFLCLFEYIYYHVQLNSVLTTGAETMSLPFLLMTAMVAGMMQVLCIGSAEVSDRAAFTRVGSRETCFVVLYTFSVLLQVTMDLVIAYWIGKHLMDVNGIRTHDGRKIADMDPLADFVDIFEAYAMQKQLGVTVLSFGFPCAFLIPFLFEPIASIFVPRKLMCLIINSHPEIKLSDAEDYLEAVPMDLGRYGDIMINVIVASLILWFPGGFTFRIFGFLACSHLYIYWYDHWRMLRCVQNIYISSFNVDLCAQWLFGVAVSIIAAAVAFKTNCQIFESTFMGVICPVTQLHRLGIWGSPCDDGVKLIFKVVLTFFIHLILHTVILFFVVPKMVAAVTTKKEVAETPYRQTAMAYPCSWFSANLIHCLRSEYVYKHDSEKDPPFDYCVSGKEHLMRFNANIGALYSDSASAQKRWKSAKDKLIAHKRLTPKGFQERLSASNLSTSHSTDST